MNNVTLIMMRNMKRIITAVFCMAFIFHACQKEPPKGRYKGIFEGGIISDTLEMTYTTEYSFKITHSSKTEIRIQEVQSTTTSTLKKYGDNQIRGKIGIASVYRPDADNGTAIMNTIDVDGRYLTDGKEATIRGTYSSTVYTHAGSFPSQGEFILVKE
jgi:hypothetical protein